MLRGLQSVKLKVAVVLVFSADRGDEKTSTVMQFQTDDADAMTID